MKLVVIYTLCLCVAVLRADSMDDETTVNSEVSEKSEKAKYVKPIVKGSYHFLETFDLDTLGTKWLKSKAKKEDVDESIAKYDGDWAIEESVEVVLDGNKGLVLKSKAKHHAVSSRLLKPFQFTNGKPFVVQYEVKFQNALECGGAYVKLLVDEPKLNLDTFYDKTDFSVMFGPDKCGVDNKYHLIVRYKHPIKATYEEKHAKKSQLVDTIFSDGKTHLYTLIVRPDNTFRMLIDEKEVNSGSLFTDLTPAINPPKEIIDPNDKKPEGWDDRDKIPDPDANKPDDWDENEPKTIADPNAVKPDGWLDDEPDTIGDLSAVKPQDWDQETDGEWEAPRVDNPKCKNGPGCGVWTAPMINNPKYKGKWKAPLIDNTNYQGKWEARKIANPDFFEDTNPFISLSPFSAIGLELWSMTDNIYFDNFIITDDETVAQHFAKSTWHIEKDNESIQSKSSESVVDTIINATNDRPWMWAVYLLVVLLPIVIIVVFCCGKTSDKPADKSKEAEAAKKSDAPSKDDEPPKDEQADKEHNEQDEPEDEKETQSEAAPSVSKSDLEAEDEAAGDDDVKSSSTKVTKRKARKT